MRSLSRAKLLKHATQARGFVYQAPEIIQPSNGAHPDGLPPGAELLWNGNPAEENGSHFEKPLTDEDIKAREQQAWQQGFQAGVAESREKLEKALATERHAVAAAVAEFGAGREAYYQKVEGEVVRLVLSIARRVLRRESQVDPMLLKGIVRVALEKIARGTAVKLRVPSAQAEAWRAELHSMPGRELDVEVIADDSLSVPSCLVMTEMGGTEISLEGQLEEIERGFLDLLAERPGSGAATV